MNKGKSFLKVLDWWNQVRTGSMILNRKKHYAIVIS